MKPQQLAVLMQKWNPEGDVQMSVLPAIHLEKAHCPIFPTAASALIHSMGQTQTGGVKRALLAMYPDDHSLQLAVIDDQGEYEIHLSSLSQLDQKNFPGEAVLWVPPLGADTSFEAFQEIIGHLRAPDGCPWDRQQTHQTLRMHLLGETYEALAAMDANNPLQMAEEFGDLLLQIVLNAQIASESGGFNMAKVLQGIHRKIVRRHPHVFGEVIVDGVGDVLTNWEAIKAAERQADGAANGEEKPKGLLDGVPEVFPSLAQAQEIQERAARVGFDWHEIAPVLAKVLEELDELQKAGTAEERESELGDLLFAVVNLSRWLKVDAESALRATNQRFRRRFAYVEEQARLSGHAMSTMTLDELDVFWNQAKELGL